MKAGQCHERRPKDDIIGNENSVKDWDEPNFPKSSDHCAKLETITNAKRMENLQENLNLLKAYAGSANGARFAARTILVFLRRRHRHSFCC